jgi:hypothetical protein
MQIVKRKTQQKGIIKGYVHRHIYIYIYKMSTLTCYSSSRPNAHWKKLPARSAANPERLTVDS